MLRTLTLNHFWEPFFQAHRSVGRKRYDFSKKNYWLALVLLALNLALLSAYVYSVNDLASRGYEIKTLQGRIKQLDEENKKINLKISEASSMVAIQQDFLSSNFVPAGTSKFLVVDTDPARLTMK